MRIVSLLPSATEFVCALGAGQQLLAVSHECDYPGEVQGLPRLTRPRYANPQSADHVAYTAALKAGAISRSAAIDETIRAIRLDALSPYLLETELLARLQPELVLTQDLCDVCAPTIEEVRLAVREHCGKQARVLSLTPHRLNDVRDNLHQVAAALGREAEGLQLRRDFEERLYDVQRMAQHAGKARSILCLEWFEPVMSSGLWVPDLLAIANSTDCVQTPPGARSRVLTAAELAALDPDVILLKPCGYSLEQGRAELATLMRQTPWAAWRAVQAGQSYLTDGSAYFNRPGPRLADSCEILAAALYPELFPQLRHQHARAVLRVGPQLETAAWV